MNDHLVALARCTGIEVVVQRRFRDHRQRVGLLLGQARRIALGVVDPGPGVHPVPGGVEGSPEDGAGLGRQETAYHDHAVRVLIHVQATALVPLGLLLVLGIAVHPAPGRDNAFDVGGGPVPGEGEQALLRLGRGRTGERAHL